MLINAVSTGKLPVSDLITHRFNLSDMMQAYETFINASDNKTMKIFIDATK
ncbi:hypothetical protein JIY74_34935 [Vibrio harveyi]|nr:hypothetical protein [Vibrio harveyi]